MIYLLHILHFYFSPLARFFLFHNECHMRATQKKNGGKLFVRLLLLFVYDEEGETREREYEQASCVYA